MSYQLSVDGIHLSMLNSFGPRYLAQVAEDGGAMCHFYTIGEGAGRDFDRVSTSSSTYEATFRDPFDFTIYMDRVRHPEYAG